MTILRIAFAGEIKKADHKQINGKAMVEVSLCKKHKGRNGAEDSFTWIRVAIWEPAEFQLAKLTKGTFIAGSGDFQHRSYEKDGKTGHSCDVRCTSFDVEIGGSVTESGAVKRPAAAAPLDDEPAF